MGLTESATQSRSGGWGREVPPDAVREQGTAWVPPRHPAAAAARTRQAAPRPTDDG